LFNRLNLDQRAFLPTIQIRPWAALRSHHPGHEVSKDKRPPAKFAQSAALLHLVYGRTLDRELMGSDAFYAFHELFVFCASSHAQLLALIEDNISAEDVGSEASPETLGLAQSNYMYMQEFLEGLVSRLQANVETIKVRGGPSWPRSDTTAAADMAKTAAETLRKDYEWLLRRAEVLSERCKSKIGHLTTLAMLAESKKAMEQAEKVTQLTRLAFIFVPLSCTSSMFGMNLTPLVDAHYSLWLWGAVSFPIVGVALLLMSWDIRVLFGKLMRNVRRDKAVA
jgi:Mg2+ and Co2+ transporter CorA